jgi:predicted outer membrane protein
MEGSDQMRVVDLTAAAAALLLGAVPFASAGAQDAAAKDSVRLDSQLVRQAVDDNRLEARLGEVAQHRASNKMVQGFAERMVTEHQRLEKQWTDLASKYGITVPDTLEPHGRARVQHMQGVSRPSFDKAYMTAAIKAHGQEADQLRTELDSAHSNPVRKMVGYERPIVMDHLKGALATGKEVGVDSTVMNESKKIAEGKASK